MDAFTEHLTEFPVTFPPSYPFEEKITQAASYMQTRCPAWCDRVLLSHTARKLISDDDNDVEYGLMGRNICMGDHKVSVFYLLTVLAMSSSFFLSSLNTIYAACFSGFSHVGSRIKGISLFCLLLVVVVGNENRI